MYQTSMKLLKYPCSMYLLSIDLKPNVVFILIAVHVVSIDLC